MVAPIVVAAAIAGISFLAGRMSTESSGVVGKNEETIEGSYDEEYGVESFEGLCEGMYEKNDHGGRKKYSLTIDRSFFQKIASGAKTIELRVGNATKLQDFVGKEIYFFNKEDRESLTIKIEKIVHYETLEEAAKGVEKQASAVLGEPGKKADILRVYEPFCQPERVSSVGGVIAIHFSFVRLGK